MRLDGLPPAQVEARLDQWLDQPRFRHVATVNPEFIVEARRNPAFRAVLERCDLNVCDGFGIVFWSRLLYGRRPPRITGVTLAEDIICRLAAEKGRSVYFLGGFGVAAEAAERMKTRHPGLIVAGAEDGDPGTLSEALRAARPDVILVAFGAPKQELWIDLFRDELPDTRLAVGVGGAFDYWTGRARRPPALFRRLGLEWLWRLGTEPRKRARRIWRAVAVFSWAALREKLAAPSPADR